MRYGLHRNQPYGWRREFGSGASGEAMAEQGPDFVPVVADTGSSAAIEIEIGRAIVCVRAGVDLAVLCKVLGLLKAMR